MATTDVLTSVSALDLMPAKHKSTGKRQKKVIKKKKEERGASRLQGSGGWETSRCTALLPDGEAKKEKSHG